MVKELNSLIFARSAGVRSGGVSSSSGSDDRSETCVNIVFAESRVSRMSVIVVSRVSRRKESMWWIILGGGEWRGGEEVGVNREVSAAEVEGVEVPGL